MVERCTNNGVPRTIPSHTRTAQSVPMTYLSPLHLGSLHPYELALVMLVAFGPFVVLLVVVYVVRRRDVAEEQADPGGPAGPPPRGR